MGINAGRDGRMQRASAPDQTAIATARARAPAAAIGSPVADRLSARLPQVQPHQGLRRLRSDQSARQRQALRLQGRHGQHLLEDIALGVAAADAAQCRAGGRQMIDGTAEVAAAVGQHAVHQVRAACGHDGGLGLAGAGKGAAAFGEAPVGAFRPGGGQGHGEMRVGENQHVVADALGRAGRQFLPAVADIHADLLQPPQQGGGVGDVERVVGRFRAHLAVVEVECRVIAAAVPVEEGPVPPQMIGEVVAFAEIAFQAGDPGDALVGAALHFQHVGHGMVAQMSAGCISTARRPSRSAAA